MCMFQGIKNVKKSKVTKDSDGLEILSEAVKWKECDENWKIDYSSVNMPTIQRYLWRFDFILTILTTLLMFLPFGNEKVNQGNSLIYYF